MNSKRVILSMVIALLLVLPIGLSRAHASSSVTVQITRVDTNTSWPNRSELGITVHARVEVIGYANTDIKAMIYFKDTRGNWMRVSNNRQKYITYSMTVTPPYDDTTWDDMTFWFPQSSFGTPRATAVVMVQLPGDATATYSDPYIFSVPVSIDGGVELHPAGN